MTFLAYIVRCLRAKKYDRMEDGLMFKVGVDVGGTFTDVLLVNSANSEFFTAKVPSTPSDSSIAVSYTHLTLPTSDLV